MGSFFQVATAITDTTADILPHALGVAGADRRYILSNIQAPVGTVISQVPPTVGANALANLAGTPKATLQAENGMKFLRLTTGALDGGRLSEVGAPAPAGNFSYAVVIRHAAPSDGAAGLAGVNVRKFTNGVLGIDKASVYSDSFSSSWNLMTVSWDAAAARYDLYVNGAGKPLAGAVSIAIPSATPGACIGTYGVGDTSVAEFITWPRKFTPADHAAVYAALKAHYSVIP